MAILRSYGRFLFTVSPSSRTSPPSSSGSSNPARSRSVVVLPQPEGPSSEKNSPRWISNEMLSTAFTSPKLLETRAN